MTIFFIFIVAVVDLVILIYYPVPLEKRRASRAWPKTSGKISEGRIEFMGDSEGQTFYFARFTFIYHVSGSELTGTFDLRNFFHTEGFAASAIAKHRKGRTISVHYNPENPRDYITEFNKITNTSIWPIFLFLNISILFLLVLGQFNLL